MRLQSLCQILEAVEALVRPERMTVFGSAALLARNPDLGERGSALEKSLDVDLIVEPSDDGKAAVADEALGEGSLFHKEYGCYADLAKPDIAETFPDGWEKRCLPLAGNKSVRCLHPLDVAMIKLVLGREKDMALLKGLIQRGVFLMADLRAAYQKTPMPENEMFAAGRTLRRLERECGYDSGPSRDVPRAVRETGTTYRAGRRRRDRGSGARAGRSRAE